MTDNFSEADSDIADDSLPAVVEQLAVPMELVELQQWHRPRKQVVRERQWMMLSERLIRKLKDTSVIQADLNGDCEVRYLTLPGIDYLDVRQLSDVCGGLECRLTSTGFLASNERNPVRARARFREEGLIKAGYITSRSITHHYRIEDVASKSSQAYRELRQRGPFHIINIDACGSIAGAAANHAGRVVDAIFRIIEFQLSRSSSPWMLFLTTNVQKGGVAGQTLRGLCDAIYQNARDNEAFRDGALQLFMESATDIEAALGAAAAADDQRFLQLFSLGFAKWILHLAAEKNWELKMHNSYCYSTRAHDDSVPTMPCLAFEFIPPPAALVDPHNVTNAAPAAVQPGEDLSMRALNKVVSMQNLDHHLRDDQALRSQMIEATRNLLREAGYAAAALDALDNLDARAS